MKICGVTNEEDALLAVAMGADAIGFIFAPSPRQIAPVKAADIVKRLPADTTTVGVFRDEVPQRVVEIVHTTGLRAAQLHGFETPSESRTIRSRVPTVIKAFPAGDPRLDHVDDWGADVILMDSAVPGSGRVFDWSLAEGAPANRRILLAGGLNPFNVADAIRRVRPWGVDVASGVEASPGRKDARRLRAFIEAAKSGDSSGPTGSTGSTGSTEESPHKGREDRPFDWADDLP